MSSLYSRDIDGLFLFVSFYDHPHPTFHLSALPQSEYSEAGGWWPQYQNGFGSLQQDQD